jgi:hypothetical protein
VKINIIFVAKNKMKFRLAVIFLLFIHVVLSQAVKEKIPSYFGFQVKPIFPGVFIGTTSFDSNISGFNTTFSQAIGYSFGGVVRAGITKLIAIETGINLTQRNYKFSSSIPDSNIYVDSRLRYLTYDIPISALFYIRLADKMYMNVSIGAALSYNPTVVGVKIMPKGYHDIRQIALGKKIVGEAIGNVGFEYRTPKSGIFYLGAAARVPFAPLFYLKSEYRYQGIYLETDAQNQGRVDGSYISLEVKYFFPFIKIKGSPIKTPIE